MAWSTDIATADNMRVKLHDPDYKYGKYTEVVEAVNERAGAVGLALLPTVSRLDNFPQIRIAAHEKLSKVIALFLDNNPPATSLLDTWDNWTLASIMSELGESMIPAGVSGDIPAWLNQQYKIINLLKKVRSNVTNTGTTYVKQVNFTELISDWSTAVSTFNARAFTLLGSNRESQHFSFNNGVYYQILRMYTIPTFANNSLVSNNTTLYCYFTKSTTSSATYENNDYAININEYGPIGSEVLSPSQVSSLSAGNINNNSQSQPASNWRQIWYVDNTAGGPGTKASIFISDYTIANGFTYKDW